MRDSFLFFNRESTLKTNFIKGEDIRFGNMAKRLIPITVFDKNVLSHLMSKSYRLIKQNQTYTWIIRTTENIVVNCIGSTVINVINFYDASIFKHITWIFLKSTRNLWIDICNCTRNQNLSRSERKIKKLSDRWKRIEAVFTNVV